MSYSTLEEMMDGLSALSVEEQIMLRHKLNELLQSVGVAPVQRKVNLNVLKGLGKELWQSVDVDEYLRKERESWD